MLKHLSGPGNRKNLNSLYISGVWPLYSHNPLDARAVGHLSIGSSPTLYCLSIALPGGLPGG